MLGAIENLLLPAIQASLDAGQDVQAGPATAPAEGTPSRLAVCALRLDCEHSEGDAPGREPAFSGWQGVLKAASGKPLNFPLPAAAVGELVEVHCPPGHILARGDAWLLEERTLHLFRTPAGPVFARTRGLHCAGYRERSHGRVELELRAWARDPATVDALLARSLAAVLRCFEQLNVIDLTGAPPGLALRLARPRVGLAGIARSLDPAAPGWQLGVAQCLIHGELELALTLGTAEPEDLIRDLSITLHPSGKPAPA